MKSIPLLLKTTIFICILALCSTNIQAQKKKKKGKTAAIETADDAKEKVFKDLIKSSKKSEGLFTIYRDTVTGAVQMQIAKDQIDQEFIYFNQILDGGYRCL